MTLSAPIAHVPVLLPEVLQYLQPADGETYIDGTFGVGGYSRAILEAANCNLIAIDRDPDAIKIARHLHQDYPDRFTVMQGCFGDIQTLCDKSLYDDQAIAEERKIDGIVFDFGVSSPQIDQAKRGFSFRLDGPLDMRMGQTGQTAATLINAASADQLTFIFKQYGEERFARKMANAIVKERVNDPFETTTQLARLAQKVIPFSKDKRDPATRIFQALRIAINDELNEIDRGLEGGFALIRPGGRLIVVSFHSLEDRRVKHFMREKAGLGASISRHAPHPNPDPTISSLEILTKRPVRPSLDEVQANPRARSARLRVAVKSNHTSQYPAKALPSGNDQNMPAKRGAV